tara:strand:+ start:613 stop:996 length:384 start_codon:yes stop_codon:yes gene_type:complete
MPRFPKSSAFKMKGAPYKQTDDLSKRFIYNPSKKLTKSSQHKLPTKKYTYTFDPSKRQEIPVDKSKTKVSKTKNILSGNILSGVKQAGKTIMKNPKKLLFGLAASYVGGKFFSAKQQKSQQRKNRNE